ncbi:MAG: hypothetical protein ACOC0N_10230 [Chroococcales cyanobacterium]
MATDIQRAVGIFSTRSDAEIAMQELRDAGFNMDKVSVITQHQGHADEMSGAGVHHKSRAEQAKGGAAAGATAGAATGGVIGLIGGLGVLAIPGVGPAVEAGVVLANTLIGGGIGAAGGGLIGALIGWGIPEDRAKYYNERVSAGDYLVLVEGTPSEVSMAERVLHTRGVRDWSVYNAPTTPTAVR